MLRNEMLTVEDFTVTQARIERELEDVSTRLRILSWAVRIGFVGVILGGITNWHQGKAAQLLGIGRHSLIRWSRKLQVTR